MRCGHQTHCGKGKQNRNQNGKAKSKQKSKPANDIVVNDDSVSVRIQKQIEQQTNMTDSSSSVKSFTKNHAISN